MDLAFPPIWVGIGFGASMDNGLDGFIFMGKRKKREGMDFTSVTGEAKKSDLGSRPGWAGAGEGAYPGRCHAREVVGMWLERGGPEGLIIFLEIFGDSQGSGRKAKMDYRMMLHSRGRNIYFFSNKPNIFISNPKIVRERREKDFRKSSCNLAKATPGVKSHPVFCHHEYPYEKMLMGMI